MSLLDGLAEQLGVGGYDPVLEAEEERELGPDPALEAAREELNKLEAESGKGELSEEDIQAILNDDNPDNIAADIETGEETQDNISGDSVPEDFKAIESMLDEMLGENDPGEPTEVEPAADPEEDGAVPEAMESDDPDFQGGNVEHSSMESVLPVESIFQLIN